MNKKRIEAGAFRPLGDNECRILFVRHEDHEKNVIGGDGQMRAIHLGNGLKDAGITISSTLTSPADRAIETAYRVKAGAACAGYTNTDPRLGDMALEDPDLLKRLKAEAQTAGISAEEYVFPLAQKDDGFRHLMNRRAQEGATALLEFARQNVGKTVLAAAHAGSRMEVTIGRLRGEGSIPTRPPYLIGRGDAIELIINTDSGKLREENYLLHPDDAQAA